ncbi:mediator of RNA polymerase II transcription subunit 28 [Exaiptasia diaphana]|uniref:Mediator of RNA polymerase II transcription subunit 28 n=1 Tax=Exaiptasia diaphana TaxID=2652724 RepID=A0A913X1C7_EXADI|nr:mediator of RNA polymerase II transcription subunit 28 [Exaiptasia diaphana]KXJ16181.1 Mediator of RNA polymerase II transcription subunit 28 [Exaiptasia diaphana]
MAEDLVSSLERSLQSCITLLGVDSLEKLKSQNIDNKAGVEAAISRFLECAKQLEEDFLKKQAYVRVQHPDESLKQEISQLRMEIKQKEEVLGKLSEKVSNWTKVVDDLQRKQKLETDLANGIMPNFPS